MSGNLTYIRISLGLVVLTCSIILSLDLAGVMPREQDNLSRSRIQISESLAFESVAAADRQDFAAIRRMFDTTSQRDDDVLSIGLRAPGGRLLVATRDHDRLWQPPSEEGSSMSHARVPLLRKGERWATIEIRFADIAAFGRLEDLWDNGLVRVLLSVALTGFVTYLLYMRRLLRHLDPTSVIPPRVQATLDVMAEGVVLLDQNERIVMANSTFADRLGRSRESLMGVKASSLGWLVPRSLEPARNLPWQGALADSRIHAGTPLCIETGDGTLETFVVNGAPVGEESGQARGAIATFDSITELERKTEELERALSELQKSRDEARLRNEELQVLATCDPLTGIVNRRAFMARAELEFGAAVRDGRKLCCMMIDIDHFKRVNDVHGHSMGDEVICRLAQELVAEWPDRELVCRFGGEEFCILMTDTAIDAAVALAMRLRRSIAADGFAPVPVTASFGVSSIEFGATRFHDLLNESDAALYSSKENGRNRVTRYDEI